MLKRTKRNWHHFKSSDIGYRFQDRYDRHQRHHTHRRTFRRWLNIVIGAAIIAVGFLFFAVPGPGWVAVFVGLAFIASELAPVARALDLGEVKGRALAGRARGRWQRSPVGAKIGLALGALAVAAAAGYGIYLVL